MGRVRHPDANPITIVPARSRCDPRGDELSLPSLLGPHPSPAVPEGELDGDGDGPDRADSREPGRSVAPLDLTHGLAPSKSYELDDVDENE